MRKAMFWLGWSVLFLLPVVLAVQIFITQDLPSIDAWKWMIPFVAIAVIYFSRNRDDVLKHHVL